MHTSDDNFLGAPDRPKTNRRGRPIKRRPKAKLKPPTTTRNVMLSKRGPKDVRSLRSGN